MQNNIVKYFYSGHLHSSVFQHEKNQKMRNATKTSCKPVHREYPCVE